MSSGAGTIPAIVRPLEQDVKYAKKLALLLGASDSDTENPDKLIEFLRKTDAEKIIEHTPELAEQEVMSFSSTVKSKLEDTFFNAETAVGF